MPFIKKHNTTFLDLTDLTGGMNVSLPGELIKNNEFQKCLNYEYSKNTNKLKVRGGLSAKIISFPFPIIGHYYDVEMNSYLVFLNNQDVYVTDLSMTTYLGKTSGINKPMCDKFGGKVIIASGSTLQSYDYVALNTIPDAPIADIVFERFGRVVIAKIGEDYVKYSGLYDEEDWYFSDDTQTAKYLEVGFKDGGDIISIAELATDILVFKTNGKVYQIANEYPDWVLANIAKDVTVNYRFATARLNNDVIYVDKKGVNSISASAEYGNFKLNDAGYKVNNELSQQIFHPTIWNIVSKKQFIIRPYENNILYAYHYGMVTEDNIGPITKLQFPATIVDMCDSAQGIVISIGDGLYYWEDSYLDDYGTPIVTDAILKKHIANNNFLIKKIDSSIDASDTGSIIFSIDDIDMTIAWLEPQTSLRESERYNYRTDAIEPRIQASGKCSLNHLIIEIAEVR